MIIWTLHPFRVHFVPREVKDWGSSRDTAVLTKGLHDFRVAEGLRLSFLSSSGSGFRSLGSRGLGV